MKIIKICSRFSGSPCLSVCSYELGRYQAGQVKKDSNRVTYIDGDQAGQKAENLTPDEVSKREGINAEQIVIKITDQGYVTSHGDHYHYYNGKVPYDAIISEELLMKDSNYQLKDSDIVNEIKGGYVIKVDGKYYVYLKDAAHADNIRTKEEIKRQKQEHSHNHGGGSNDQAVVAARAQGRYTTDDGISSTHLISSKIRVMPISFLMAITSTIFRRVICLPVN